MNADLCRQRARCDVVRSAEGGKEVIQRVFVANIDSSEAQAPLVLVAVEEVVFADGGVEEASRGDALWVGVVVSGIRGGDVDEAGGELRGETNAGKRSEWSGPDAVANETSLKLLIGGERLTECADHLDGRLPIQLC